MPMRLKVLYLCLLVVFFVSLKATAKGDPEAGATKVMMCAGCHGTDGNSLVAAFPKLSGLGENYLYQQLRHVVTFLFDAC